LNTTEQPELIPKGPGDVLRQARESRRRTVESVAQAIKVRPELIDAIEKGETGRIPPVYLKGYLRSYAREVGIPPHVIEKHLSVGKAADPEVQTIFKEGVPRSHGDRWFKASSYVLASGVVLALVWQFTNEAVRFSQGDPLLRTSQTENGAPLSSNESAVDVNSGAGYVAEALPAKGHLRASIASMSGTREESSSSRPMVAEDAWAAIGDRSAGSDGLDTYETVEITTSADSWIEIIDGDDEKVEMDLLRAGSRRTYRGIAPFQLLLGRASSVEVFHNGEKVNLAPYIRGNVARLTLGGTDSDSDSGTAPENELQATEAASPDRG